MSSDVLIIIGSYKICINVIKFVFINISKIPDLVLKKLLKKFDQNYFNILESSLSFKIFVNIIVYIIRINLYKFEKFRTTFKINIA